MISRTANGKYKVSVYVWEEGRRRRKTKVVLSKNEAKQTEAELLRTRKPGKSRKPDYRTIYEATEYYRQSVYPRLRPKSKVKYEQCLKHFEHWCKEQGIIQLRQFTNEHARQYTNYVASKWKGHGAVNLLRVTKAVFLLDLTRSERSIERSPFDGLTLKKPQRKRARYLSREEEARFLAVCDDRLRDAVLLLLNTGLRRDELRYLRQDMVHGDILRIESNFEFQTKHGGARDIPLNTTAQAALASLRSPYAFSGAKLTSVNNIPTQIERAANRAGMPWITTHTFRRTFASRLFHAGVPIGHISRLLGHASVSTTEIYLGDLLKTDTAYAVRLLEDNTLGNTQDT